MTTQFLYDNAAPEINYYLEALEIEVTEYYENLCLEHGVKSREDELNLEQYRLDDPFSGYDVDKAAVAEFFRLHEDLTARLELILSVDFVYYDFPETQKEVFDLIFSKDTNLGDYDDLLENGVFEGVR